MKKSRLEKIIRWTAASAFGLMLVLNITVGFEFKKGEVVPSLTLAELGSQAYAQGESFHCEWNGSHCRSPLKKNTCGCE